MLGDNDVSWLKVGVPRAPASRLRAALVGVLEERMLDEPESVHLALEPAATPGEDAWICVVNSRSAFEGEIARLERTGVSVERVVPMSWPEDTPLGHFSEAGRSDGGGGNGGGAALQLTWSDVNGVSNVPLQGSLARAMLPRWTATPARWSAHPAVAAQAERWLGSPVFVLRDEPRALQAMRSLWNLRQFDLAPAHRGTLALREGWKRFLSPVWRPVRLGARSFRAAQHRGPQPLGLRAARRRRRENRRDHAGTPRRAPAGALDHRCAGADAARNRDLARWRRPVGEADFEALLAIVAAAWPEGRTPAESLTFEPGKLSLASTGWTEQQVLQFRSSLRPSGWLVEHANGV